jgi:dephospho-CoA kinase
MIKVGLTGGLASGKSFVGKELASLGCLVIQADELGHKVLERDGEAYDAVVREFGPEILDKSGAIDRRRLGRIVFRQPDLLNRLNALVHPPVRARTARLMEQFAVTHPSGIAVNEAAILIETGSYKNFSRLIVAFCREDQQMERAIARDHLTREEALDRMRRQMPLAEKVNYADYVIDTSGTKLRTIEQTRAVYESLLKVPDTGLL